MTEPRMAYTGTLPCGCIVSAVVDNPNHAEDVARTVGQMVMDGETVGRRSIEDLRTDPAFLRTCEHPSHEVGA